MSSTWQHSSGVLLQTVDIQLPAQQVFRIEPEDYTLCTQMYSCGAYISIRLQALRSYPWVMWFFLVFFGVLVSFGVPWKVLLESLLLWLDSIGEWGLAVMVMAFVVINFPFTFGYTPLAMAAGFLYGFVRGVVSVAIGSALGAAAAFWCCRRMLKKESLSDTIRSSRIGMVLFAMGESGWRGALLARMIPFPIGLANAILAITSITFRRFLISTVVGLFPFQLLLVYFGTTLRSISDLLSGKAQLGVMQTILVVVQVVLALGSILYFMNAAKNLETRSSMVGENGPSLIPPPMVELSSVRVEP